MSVDELSLLTESLKRAASYPAQFLSQACPLLAAARVACSTGRQEELREILNGTPWSDFVDDCDFHHRWCKEPGVHKPSTLLNARRHLVLAALGDDVEGNFRSAIELTQLATNAQPHEHLATLWQAYESFRNTFVVQQLSDAGSHAVDVFQQLAGEFGGWNPALLSTAAGFAAIFATPIQPAHAVSTHLLFTVGNDEAGILGKLTLERLEFDANAGGGAIYADPARIGYLHSRDSFQHPLQQAWWREIKPHLDTCNFDIRWSLQLVGDPGRTIDETESDIQYLRSKLFAPLSGPSAGVAFACALRALRLGEQLDPHIAITAALAEDWNDNSGKIFLVGGVPDKLRADLERAGIDEVLTSVDDQAFTGVQPDHDGIVITKPQRGKLKLIGLSRFEQCYQRASQHARVAQLLKSAMSKRAVAILGDLGGTYTHSPLSRDADLATDSERNAILKSKDESRKHLLLEQGRVSVPKEETDIILSGKGPADRPFPKRMRFLADSGFGKSTMLVEVERQLAESSDQRVPIRVGAGPARVGNMDGRPLPLPLLSKVPWQLKGDTDLERLGTWFYNHLWKPLGIDTLTKDQIVHWFVRAAEQGDVLFLLDSTDQTDADLEDLALFLQTQPQCTALVTGRPETREYKAAAYQHDDWHRYWLEPFGEAEVQQFCQDAEVAEQLWKEQWRPLVTVPVLLKEMFPLAREGKLEQVTNREAVYELALDRLVEHGRVRALDKNRFTKQLQRAKKLHSEAAWATITQESQSQGGQGSFTGRLTGSEAAEFQELLEQEHQRDEPVEVLESLGLLTLAYLEQTRSGDTGLAWRHFSFCEWFAGVHLASLPAEEQSAIIREHALDVRWQWILRFALSAAQRQQQPDVVAHLADCLLASGAAFLLWTCIDQDRITVPTSLDELCRWLVHRDRDSWKKSFAPYTSPWADRNEHERPSMTPQVAGILRRMFAVDDDLPWERRDSRWLHPAWQLVVEHLPPSELPPESWTEVQAICQHIHDGFRSEFETRVRVAAKRNQGRFRDDWEYEDAGLLQLVPDDVLLELGVLPREVNGIKTQQLLWQWPGPTSGTYEQRRDTFNGQLKQLGSNFCACPPAGWQHPYDARRDPRECNVRGTNMRRTREGDWIEQEGNKPVPHWLPAGYEMQRTPMTNRQFEAFDPSHRRERRMQWYRPELETQEHALDDHPVVEVSWYQARMLCMWLTGQGAFGQFGLPFDEDWEACCRAGRDREEDEFGIPWCDEQQRPILDGRRQEQFHSLSSHGANFDGRHPAGEAESGPDRSGTIPVGQFPANGFGVADSHGQVWEGIQNLRVKADRDHSEVFTRTNNARSLRGGSWRFVAVDAAASNRYRYDPVIYGGNVGVRVSRTK